MLFGGTGPKAPQGGPKDSPGHLPRSFFVNNWIRKNGPKDLPRLPTRAIFQHRLDWGGETSGGSPLTPDVSQMASPRFRGQFDFLTFVRSGKDGRNNCKMLSKMGFQWMHKCVKCEQIVKRIMNKRGPENLHMKTTKQGEIQTLQSLISESIPTRNSGFDFSRFVENVFQMAPKTLRN